MLKISPTESGDNLAVMLIPPCVFPLPGFAAFVMVAFGARALTVGAEKVKLHVARGELSFG
jgi:hypothetical protein